MRGKITRPPPAVPQGFPLDFRWFPPGGTGHGSGLNPSQDAEQDLNTGGSLAQNRVCPFRVMDKSSRHVCSSPGKP